MLLFPEHQKFWKSIKNPLRKLKKCETFSKNPMMMTICVDLYWYSFVFTMQINIFLPKYTFQMKIWANASHFFNFLNDFLWIFQIVGVLERGESRLEIELHIYLRNMTSSASSLRFSFFCLFNADLETKLRNLPKYNINTLKSPTY